MKTELEIGDKIKRFQLSNEFEHEYIIDSLTKTLAKSEGFSFKKQIVLYSTKPSNRFIGEAIAIKPYSNSRYFILT